MFRAQRYGFGTVQQLEQALSDNARDPRPHRVEITRNRLRGLLLRTAATGEAPPGSPPAGSRFRTRGRPCR